MIRSFHFRLQMLPWLLDRSYQLVLQRKEVIP